LANPKAHVAPSQPPLGTCQSWWGLGQSLAWPISSEGATPANMPAP
jgi:hypothetical protein